MAEILNDSNFKERISEYEVPVLVDFFATWCGPCGTMNPIIEELAEEEKDNYKVFKVNVDESPELAKKYHIRGIPTLIIFSKGNEIIRKLGVSTKRDLLDCLLQ